MATVERRNSFSNRKPPKPVRMKTASKLVKPTALTPEIAVTIIQRRWRFHYARRNYLKIQKQITRRNKIVQEILSTEQSYLNSLKVLSKVFLKPMEDSGLVEDSNEIKSLFGGIKVIIGYNSILLTDLQQRIPQWSVHSKLGDVFLRLVAFLKAYTQYVNTYKQSIDLLEKKKRTKQYVEWESKLDITECGGLQMGDYLIMPIQRIPRYNMLLGDLYSNTWPFHVDYENLGNAHKRIQDIALHVNASQREAESMRKVTEILLDIQSQGSRLDNLIEPWRRFISDGQFLAPTGKYVHLYLFNDVLLFTNIKKEKKYYDKLTDLLNVTVTPIEDNPLAFSLRDGKETNIFTTKTENDRKKWLESYHEAMNSRHELKKATDELITKNIDQAKKTSSKKKEILLAKDDQMTLADKRAGFRKTASSGSIGSMVLVMPLTMEKKETKLEEEKPEPRRSGSRRETREDKIDKTEESDGTEEKGDKKKLRRTPSLKNLLNITHSGDFKRPSLAGLLSPRESRSSSDSKPQSKADFYASLSKQPHAMVTASAPAVKKEETTDCEDDKNSMTRSRGRTLTGVSNLWSKAKKKGGERERRGSDAAQNPVIKETPIEAPPSPTMTDPFEVVSVWKKNNFEVSTSGTIGTTSTPVSPRKDKEPGWKKFLS